MSIENCGASLIGRAIETCGKRCASHLAIKGAMFLSVDARVAIGGRDRLTRAAKFGTTFPGLILFHEIDPMSVT